MHATCQRCPSSVALPVSSCPQRRAVLCTATILPWVGPHSRANQCLLAKRNCLPARASTLPCSIFGHHLLHEPPRSASLTQRTSTAPRSSTLLGRQVSREDFNAAQLLATTRLLCLLWMNLKLSTYGHI